MKKNIQHTLDLIENSKSIGDLYDLNAIPQVNFSNSFFFISYSHSDYKKVYKDIVLLQEQKIDVWYDKGMVPGKDWQIVAESYISKFACKGVIIYISENALSSDAVVQEIKKATTYGKPIIPIIMTESGDNLSLVEMIDKYTQCNSDANILKETFTKNVIYLEYSMGSNLKADKIRNAMSKENLIGYATYENDHSLKSQQSAMVNKVLDSELHEITIPKIIENNLYVVGVERAVFANFFHLQTVNTPPFHFIFDYAFFNCNALKKITLADNVHIAKYAFYNCASLEQVILSNDSNENDYSYIAWQDFLSNHSEFYVENIISTCAFCNCRQLKHIDLPNNTTHIGKQAFKSCSSLKKIILPNCLKKIGAYAFQNCENLEEIIIPNSVEDIEEYAFANCSSLKKVVLSKSISKIKTGVFWNCPNLIDFECEISKLDTIKEYAFGGCTQLQLNLKDCKAKISPKAFYGCDLVKYPVVVDDLDSNAFQFNNCINEVTILNAVESIPKNAFECCAQLQKVNIPTDSVIKTVESDAFYFCSSLIDFPIEQVESFGDQCFEGSGIISAKINAKVTHIGEAAFGACTSLISIAVEKNNPIFCDIDGVLFNKQTKTLLCYPSGKIGDVYKIPDGTEEIAEAFIKCVNLKKIILPKSVKRIKVKSFDNKIPLIYSLYYEGSLEDFDSLDIDDVLWHTLFKATSFYSEVKPTNNNICFWHYDQNNNIVVWDE